MATQLYDDVTSSNLTLSNVQYNNSGIYLHDTKDQCNYWLSVGGMVCVLLMVCLYVCDIF